MRRAKKRESLTARLEGEADRQAVIEKKWLDFTGPEKGIFQKNLPRSMAGWIAMSQNRRNLFFLTVLFASMLAGWTAMKFIPLPWGFVLSIPVIAPSIFFYLGWEKRMKRGLIYADPFSADIIKCFVIELDRRNSSCEKPDSPDDEKGIDRKPADDAEKT